MTTFNQDKKNRSDLWFRFTAKRYSKSVAIALTGSPPVLAHLKTYEGEQGWIARGIISRLVGFKFDRLRTGTEVHTTNMQRLPWLLSFEESQRHVYYMENSSRYTRRIFDRRFQRSWRTGSSGESFIADFSC
jgi:hypothetical protein